MSEQGNFVIVAGNIGVGKTTVAKGLSEKLGYKLFRERVGDNPYLDDFYGDMKSWAFLLQRFFLFSRTVDHEVASRTQPGAVLDRSVYEDSEIFAKHLHLMGNISEEDYNLYHMYYDKTIETLAAPSLLIYLQASIPTLHKRIAKRNRSYEQELLNSQNPYLRELNELYESFYMNYDLGPKLLVDADKIDVISNPGDLEKILEDVHKQLTNT